MLSFLIIISYVSQNQRILFHLDFVSNQNQNKTENSDFDDLKWMKKDKIIIISHYYFLCKSESENSVSFWFCSISSHQIKVQFCFISWKMNLILFHFTEKKFDFISLRLLSSSVSFHFMKKNLILSHLMKIKSDSVSFHWKKNLILFWFWLRTELNQDEKFWFLWSA